MCTHLSPGRAPSCLSLNRDSVHMGQTVVGINGHAAKQRQRTKKDWMEEEPQVRGEDLLI